MMDILNSLLIIYYLPSIPKQHWFGANFVLVPVHLVARLCIMTRAGLFVAQSELQCTFPESFPISLSAQVEVFLQTCMYPDSEAQKLM